jgi:hypothetical protein
MIDPTRYGPGEGERIDAGAGSAIVLKATGEATDGSFFMSESTVAPGFSGRRPISTDSCTTCSTSLTAS